MDKFNSDLENLSYRAGLAMNYLDGNGDEKLGGCPFFDGDLLEHPRFIHAEWDACDVGWRMVEAYILNRQVLAIGKPGYGEERLRKFLINTLAPDGLSYRPENSWCKKEAFMWDHGRALIALAAWLKYDPDDQVFEISLKMAEGLSKIATKDESGWYFPAENWNGNEWGNRVLSHPPTGLAIEGLVDLFVLTGREELLEHARQYAKAVMGRIPLLAMETGEFIRKGGGPYPFHETHIHSRLGILTGLLKLSRIIGDNDLALWIYRCYRWVASRSSAHGWVPEVTESGYEYGGLRHDEVCCITDMINLAGLFARHGYDNEYDVLQKYLTNQVYTQQFLGIEPFTCHIHRDEAEKDSEQIVFTGMPERAVGCFVGACRPNQLGRNGIWWGHGEFYIEPSGCCSPAGIKALFLGWNSIISHTAAGIRINTWINTHNDLLQIECLEPVKGEIVITARKDLKNVLLRIPDWVDKENIISDLPVRRIGRDLALDSLNTGCKWIVSYELKENIVKEAMEGRYYPVRWKGGKVISIEPKPEIGRLFWWRE